LSREVAAKFVRERGLKAEEMSREEAKGAKERRGVADVKAPVSVRENFLRLTFASFVPSRDTDAVSNCGERLGGSRRLQAAGTGIRGAPKILREIFGVSFCGRIFARVVR
jgi:hypothetical protein